MNTLKIYYVCVIVLLSAVIDCSGARHYRQKKAPVQVAKKINIVPQPQPAPVVSSVYKARLDGVECSLCAQAATKILSAMDGIDSVQVSLINEQEEHAQVTFVWRNTSDTFDLTTINKALDKEGFEMVAILAQ